MSLKPCPECGHSVSSQATRCPSCGVRLRKPRRGIFGVVAKYSFILFNVLMIAWIWGALSGTGDLMAGRSEAEQAGVVAGTAISVFAILVLWVLGDVILGMLTFFTRVKE